jgi:hypothetical protein
MPFIIGLAALVTAFLLERRPRRVLEFPPPRRRLSNIGIWLSSLVIVALIFPPPPPLFAWPITDPMLSYVSAFLCLDLLSYALHRAQHAVPVLWRLHAVHHSDPDLDFSTSVRRHPFEFVIASGVFWLAVLLGIPVAVAVAHGTTLFVLAAFSHCNTRWPDWIERLLRPLVVTADLHVIHHSIEPHDAKRNFGAVLSVWDRLFGTFAPAHPIAAFGVADLDRVAACCPMAMLLTPWAFPAGTRGGEALPAEFRNDPKIQAAMYDPDEERRRL